MNLSYCEADDIVADPSILAGEERNTATSGQTTNANVAISASKHSQASLLNLLIYSLPFVSRTYVDRLLVFGNVDLVELGQGYRNT